MGTSRLAVYNRALSHLGQRPLATETENVESRRALDREFDDAVKFCLQRGFWNFAMVTVEAEPETAVDPLFGHQYAFAKPSDWLRTYAIGNDERGSFPTDFRDEGGYWHADGNPVYVRYVSLERGQDLAQWPPSFAEAFALYLAQAVCERLTQSDAKLERIDKMLRRAMAHALSVDAMDEGAQHLPAGSWSRARLGGYWGGSGRYTR
jgi:hypothetical protein